MNVHAEIVLQAILWSCCALVAYTYAGYPLLLFLASSAAEVRQSWNRVLGRDLSSNREAAAQEVWPLVSVVVAAHNEADQLPGLLESLSHLEYPRDRLELVMVSDGSTDGTAEFLQAWARPGVQVVVLPRQGGKPAALNAGVACARHDILLLTDASTRPQPDTLRKLVRHFDDPTVGVVCGALRFLHNPDSKHTEGAYWSYECLLRLMEARLGATLTASGALYALRKSCFPPLRATSWIEDFLVPMHARQAGFRVLYDPEAWAFEVPAPSVRGEFKRRVRLAMGSFRALGTLVGTRLDGCTRWAFFSHKVLRWCVPFFLVLILVTNVALWPDTPYRLLLLTQLGLYGLAFAGAANSGPAHHSRLAQGLYFFVAMNAAFFWGFVLFLWDRGETAWEQVR
ncbi:MAG: glycosyltransferase family 2 protein [Chloroflexota bacterium]